MSKFPLASGRFCLDVVFSNRPRRTDHHNSAVGLIGHIPGLAAKNPGLCYVLVSGDAACQALAAGSSIQVHESPPVWTSVELDTKPRTSSPPPLPQLPSALAPRDRQWKPPSSDRIVTQSPHRHRHPTQTLHTLSFPVLGFPFFIGSGLTRRKSRAPFI